MIFRWQRKYTERIAARKEKRGDSHRRMASAIKQNISTSWRESGRRAQKKVKRVTAGPFTLRPGLPWWQSRLGERTLSRSWDVTLHWPSRGQGVTHTRQGKRAGAHTDFDLFKLLLLLLLTYHGNEVRQSLFNAAVDLEDQHKSNVWSKCQDSRPLFSKDVYNNCPWPQTKVQSLF